MVDQAKATDKATNNATDKATNDNDKAWPLIPFPDGWSG